MLKEDDVETGEHAWPLTRPRETVSSLVQVDLGALSHPGKVRRSNEDHFMVARFERVMQTLMTSLPPGLVPDRAVETVYGMLVADGIGGAAAGEVASQTAISALVDLVLQTPDWIMRPDDQTYAEVLRRAQERFRKTEEALIEQVRSDPRLSGMGTTMTVAYSLGADLIVAHVGDSRAYLVRAGQHRQLTRDDTIAQSMADAGVIRPEEVATHPMRHVLTDAIGTGGSKAKTELHRLQLIDGDQVLLCTDGLTEMVTDAELASALQGPGTAAELCRILVDLAVSRGGRDNVTVVLARYRIPTSRPSAD